MSVFKVLGFILQKIRITRKISSLHIGLAGTEEGTPFVELDHGLRFYGLKVQGKDKKYYKLLKRSTRKILPLECYRVALDIVIRYHEGGLKLGGPEKERYYKVKEGDTVAEMGAYMGYYTLYLAEKTGSSGKVVAIEPMPDNLAFLEKNVAYNKLGNVVVVKKGVWNKNDIQTFYQTGHDTQSASLVLDGKEKNVYNIEVNTLDKILEDHQVKHVDLMLIQLNGIEPEALEGLTIIKPEHMAIAARYNSDGAKPVPRIRKTLNDRNYTVKVVKRDYVYASQN